MASLLETVRDNVRQLNIDMGRSTQPVAENENASRILDALRRGVMYFYADCEVQVGHKDIDWSGRHVQHQEWPAQLNRFKWLAPVAAAYEVSKDESIASLARGYIEDWINQHDYSATSGPSLRDNTLNISIRIGQSTGRGWWSSAGSFVGSKAFDDAFIERMRVSVAGQMDCLRANIAGETNWRISHIDSLLFCGLVVPGLEKHRDWAIRQLNETFLRQIHEDGSHEEHNPNSYHGWMSRVFTAYWRLSRARPSLGLKFQDEKVARMWDYYVHATPPDGGSGGLHDGPRWTPGKGRIESLEERERVLVEAGLANNPAWNLKRQPSRYFSSAGQLFVRDRWDDTGAMWACFDATRWGGGHCHLSRNSINLYAGGRMLVCDPGVFSYEASDPFATFGKSTPAHNTINLAGMNQCEANPDVTHVVTLDDLTVINSVYEGGYYPGQYHWGFYEGRRAGTYGQHARTMVYLAGRGVLVFDSVMVDAEGQQVAAHWQLQTGNHAIDADTKRVWTTGGKAGDTNVLVQLLGSLDPVGIRVFNGQHRPQRGWLPVNTYGQRETAPQVAFAFSPSRRWGHLETLLLPFKGDAPPALKATPFSCDRGRARGYVIAWPDGVETVVAASPNFRYQVGDTPHLSTDGVLAVVQRKGGKTIRATIVEGSYLRVDDATLINEPAGGTHRWGG